MIPLLLPHASIVECYTTADSFACGKRHMATHQGHGSMWSCCAKAKRPKKPNCSQLAPVAVTGSQELVRWLVFGAVGKSNGHFRFDSFASSTAQRTSWSGFGAVSDAKKLYLSLSGPIPNVKKITKCFRSAWLLSKSQWRSKYCCTGRSPIQEPQINLFKQIFTYEKRISRTHYQALSALNFLSILLTQTQPHCTMASSASSAQATQPCNLWGLVVVLGKRTNPREGSAADEIERYQLLEIEATFFPDGHTSLQ